MNASPQRILCQLLVSAIAAIAPLRGQADRPLDAAIVDKLGRLLAKPSDDDGAKTLRQQIWRDCAILHGTFGPLFDHLDAHREKKPARTLELHLARIHAHYLRRLGDLSPALSMLKRIETTEETVGDTLAKAEVLDALGRDELAIATYDRLLQKPIDQVLKNRILLRKSLMADGAEDKPTPPARRPTRRVATLVGPGSRLATPVPTPAGKDDKKKKRSALARFAAGKGVSTELRNQAAVVLALTNEQKEAIQLFQCSGKGTARFRQEVRVAEWAIEAENYGAAQESAWRAVQHAKLRRDRRYALTILVEGYRRADKLDGLIERFASAPELDVESRETWIDLLRERGKVEAALALFRQSRKGQFTADMRRELLEICRETDQDHVLEDAYKRLIAEEPRFLEWRDGLARFYLERGRNADALGVWRPYLQVTDDNRYRMAAASTLMGLGLDDLAVEFARTCMAAGDASDQQSALLFLFELHKDRGRHEDAGQALAELDRVAAPGAGVRKEMADAYARLGDKEKAVAVLEKLYATLGDETTPDTRMKLALMLSETGNEKQALEHWQSLWRQINSIPRRRYVEERMMTVSARLGNLAKIAIDLEKKLVAGTASDRDAGLLVRLYIKVNDPVSATEVIDEHMKKSGKKPVDVLTEKARVFQSCNDYYNYEKVVQQLIEVDPDGRPDYLRQLAMSHMERGQRRKAREILERLKRVESDAVSDEFEAGVLALAGMREEALCSYRRGIAKFPERIDTYLLLSNVQKQLGRHERSAGMFQYLAATAEKDDLFTIAVDGILNMRTARSNRGAPDRVVEWTRRVVLERLARRSDKLYLFRLVADLSDELNDDATAIRSLKTALPVAGEQRTQLLRELMAMAKKAAGGNRRPGIRILPGGVVMAMRAQGDGKTNSDLLMFGRRILGQAEIVPPGVYLELGGAFLDAGEIANAEKTFNQASQLPEFAEMRRKFAQAFEMAGYPEEALRVYEKILSVENGDVTLITKVGELREQTGNDDVARGLYERGLELLLDRSVFVKTGVKEEEKPKPTTPFVYMPRNRNTDEWDRHHHHVLSGLLATMSEEMVGPFLDRQRTRIRAGLARITKERRNGTLPADGLLSHHPRLRRRLTVCRRISIAFGHTLPIDKLDRTLLGVFAKDTSLLEELVRLRLSWGYVASARKLVEDSGRPEAERKKLRLLTGARGSVAVPGVISVPEAAGLMLPLLVKDRRDTATKLLERLSLSTDDKSALEHMQLLVGASVFLRQPDLTLTLCRHWLNLGVRHSPATMYVTVESILRQGRVTLDDVQLQSLTEHLLTKVIENPDKFTVFIRRLPQLRKTTSANFLSRDQLEKLIKSRLSGSDRFTYGVEELFVMLAPEDRSSVLRQVWDKLPKTRKAYFLLRLVSVLDHEVDSAFAEFLAGGFRKALQDSDDKRILGYQVVSLANAGTVNATLRLKLIEAMVDDGNSGASLQAGRAMLLHKLGEKKAAMEAVRQVFLAVLASKGGARGDPMATSAFYQLVSNLGRDHVDELLAVLDNIEKKQGTSLELTKKRLDMLGQLRRQDDSMLTALEDAVRKHPDEFGFRDRLANLLHSRGARGRAQSIRAAGVERKPKDKMRRKRLVATWRNLHHPIRALAARLAGAKHEAKPKDQKATAANEAVKKKKTPPANLKDVKKALSAGDHKTAQTTFRRLWRQFSPLDNDPYARIYMSIAMRGQMGHFVWPADDKKGDSEKNDAKKKKVARGGLPEMFTREMTAEEKRRSHYGRRSNPFAFPGVSTPAKDGKKVRTAHEVLAGHEFGRREIGRQLRCLAPNQLGSVMARDIYKALVEVKAEAVGRGKVLDDLLARDQAGETGKIDYGMLSVLLDDLSKTAPERMKNTLVGLTANMNPRDEAQLRRLARLHARAGEPTRASTLYRWCAVLSNSGRLGFYFATNNDLLDEVIANLEGDERIRAVEDILAYSNPGEFGRDPYLRTVLETWMDLLDPVAALEKSRKVLEEVTVLDMMPSRQASKMAALMHARAGEIDAAIACLEIALCKLEPPEQTRYPWYRTMFSFPGSLSTHELALLFPFGMKGFAKPDEWLARVHTEVTAWHNADRLNESMPLRLLSVLALRLHEQWQTDLANATLTSLEKLAGKRASDLLWVADVSRLCDRKDLGDEIERRLFDQGQLHVERVPDLIARVVETRGAKAGLELGNKATALTLHPDLLAHLVAAAKSVGNLEQATRWEKTRTDAEAAKKLLEEQDEKRAEEAKRKRGG